MRGVELGNDFRPAIEFRKLLYVYLVSVFLVLFFLIYFPILVFAPLAVTLVITLFPGLPVLFVFLFTAWWISKYYRTIVYRLTGDEMIWRRGVWFKKTGVVPYNRITNVDIDQGPVSRKFGIAAIKIQTAGYSSPHQRTSEIKIEGMKNFEEIRETIMDLVRGKKPVAVETYDEDPESSVLKELVKIRKLLEKKR